MLWTPATISRPPSAGITMLDIAPAKKMTMSATQIPDRTVAHRERAPAITLSAVELTEPPTGRPRKRPDTAFAAPCAMKSREELLRVPSALGALWLTPAPWTRMIAAKAIA